MDPIFFCDLRFANLRFADLRFADPNFLADLKLPQILYFSAYKHIPKIFISNFYQIKNSAKQTCSPHPLASPPPTPPSSSTHMTQPPFLFPLHLRPLTITPSYSAPSTSTPPTQPPPPPYCAKGCNYD